MSKRDSHHGVFIGLYVPAELKEWLANKARNNAETTSETLRKLIEKARKNDRSAKVLAKNGE